MRRGAIFFLAGACLVLGSVGSEMKPASGMAVSEFVFRCSAAIAKCDAPGWDPSRALPVPICGKVLRLFTAPSSGRCPFALGTHRPAGPLVQHEFRPPVHGAAGKGFARPVRPKDVHGVDVINPAQSEVGPRIIAAQVAGTRVDSPHPMALASPNGNLRAVGIPF